MKIQKIESPENIKNWLINNNLSTEHVYTIAPEQFLEYTIATQNAPLLFEKNNGHFLALGFINGKYCPKGLDKNYSTILPYHLLKAKPDSFLINETIAIPNGYSIKDQDKFIHRYDTTFLNLRNLTMIIRTLNGQQVNELPDQKTDYILILPFAIYLGNKLQLKDIRKYYYAAINNRISRINIIFLNLDKQAWWGEKWLKTNTLN